MKFKTSKTAAQNVLDSLKKQRNKLRLKKCVLKKSTSSVGNVGTLTLLQKIIAKERDAKNN